LTLQFAIYILLIAMTLGEKVRSLRTVEGEIRGLGREMSQLDVARAMRRELGAAFSQSYLSQIESGARPHLTHRTRGLLARFFKVHPGYLVSDPPGFHTQLTSELRGVEDQLDDWLRKGAEQFGGDAELQNALLRLVRHPDSRKCLVLLGTIVDTPELVDRLLDALTPSSLSSTPPPGDPERLQKAGHEDTP
jgi:transcriptional regulator with XRE-family HTH domain